MALVLDEEQTMLAQTAGSFMRESSPITRFRALRDAGEERGYSLDVYKQMAELGWTGIPFSEADGGMDMGLAGLVIVTEAMGRGLAPEPLVASIGMAGQALALAGTADQKAAWLAPAIEGDKVLALAYAERGQRFDLRDIALSASTSGDGFVVDGEKTLVMGGYGADAFIVAARTSGTAGDADGLTLLLVPANTAGVSTVRQQRVDSQNSAILKLDGVKLGADALLGEVGKAHAPLCDVIDRATVALCGEMLGGMNEAFDLTLGYLKERRQFDTLIGTFQALQHRAARMYIELELARSTVMAAARAIDDNDPRAKSMVSIAKAKLSDAYCLITNEAVQIFGGIGMTDEHDIGFFMKRARGCEMTFGDAAYHRERFAGLSDY